MTQPARGPEKPTPESFINFITTHKWESISYVLLFVGLILTFFYPLIGGALVGLIFGISFAPQIHERVETFKEFIHVEGIFRSFIVIVALLTLLILAFGWCAGAVVGAYIRPYLPKF